MSPLPTTGTGTAATTDADRVPVGGEAIARIARAAVHEQRIGAAIDRGLRLLDHVAHLVVPAEPQLHGHRNLGHRLLHRFGDAADALRLAAERRADALVREVIDRAAAIEIDEVGAARFDERRGPADLFGIGAGQLHAEERLAFELADQRELALAALLQPPRHRHLADRHARAQLDAQAGDREDWSLWSSAPSPRRRSALREDSPSILRF